MKVDLYKDTRDDSLHIVTTETWNEFRLKSLMDAFVYAFSTAVVILWIFGKINISWS